tara:strand:- start:32542 stop:33447 length:906 start_codon:yes stop_codon:yes gene_type:complete
MSQDRLWGVHPAVIAAFAVFFGTVIDSLVRHVNGFIDLTTLIFWRFAIGAVLVGIPYFLSGRRLPGWKATRFHAVRGITHLLAASLFFFALTKLELATVTVLGFTAVLWIIPIAWIALGERPKPIAVLAGLLGFCGVLLTFVGAESFDGFTTDDWLGFASVMSAAMFYAISIVLLRLRASEDGAFAIAFYANLFPAIYMAGPAFILTEGVVWGDALWLVLLGICGTLVWLFMTLAYGRAPAQQLAPTEYTALIWSALIGWLVFNEVPKGLFWLGAIVIIAACLLVSIPLGELRRYLFLRKR